METSLNHLKCAVLITIVVGMVSLVSAIPYHYGRDHVHSTVRDQVVHFSSANGFDEKSFLSCRSCKALVLFARGALSLGWSEQEIVKGATEVCVLLNEVDRRVCVGLVNMFKAEVLTVFENLFLSPDEVCGLAFGSDCAKTFWPFDAWNVSLPGVPKPPVSPHVLPKLVSYQSGSPTLRVLHLTDIHLDRMYSPGSNAVCDEPLCCRADDGKPAPGVSGAGRYGDYRNCDTPTWTLEDLFSHLAKQKFDYIMWTGDLPAHNIWNQTRAAQVGILKNLTSLVEKYFPNKPVVPALGNHESSPVNSFPPRDITGVHSIGWLYDALADAWQTWLPASALTTVRKGGYYTFKLFPGLRVISINTNACNDMNWWLYLNTTDPDGQLAWLVDTLQAAENNKEKVHIIGHIPPGIDDCLESWSHNYYTIIDRYESTIKGQFFGHTHFDHFEVFYDAAKLTRPTNVAYISPSVTPYSNLNMGYRFFTMDGNYSGSSWEVLDHETYILNLTAANAGSSPPSWQLEYTAKEAFQMKSLFPGDWNDLITRLEKNNTLLQTVYRYYYKSNINSPCDAECSKDLICSLRSGRSYSMADFCPGHGVRGRTPRHSLFAKMC